MNKELTPLEAYKKVSEFCREWLTFDNELDIIEKSLKALEIIKEKKVNLGDFMRCEGLTAEEYNDYFTYRKEEELTEEEFNLLKEVLL